MGNEKAIKFFNHLKDTAQTPRLAIKLGAGDLTSFDADFILKFANKESAILDLGSGSGLTVNKIYSKVSHITAVEFFKEYSQYIVDSKNVEIKNVNILDFVPAKKYDIVSCFGIMHYFSTEEKEKIYKMVYSCLKQGGCLIVKQQFGVEKNVEVDNFSQKLQYDYFSRYDTVADETERLKKIGFSDFEAFDIYPEECNKWQNTHFYAITARKN